MKEMMYTLRESLCNELDNIAQRGTFDMGDLEVMHKLTDTIKNIYKIESLENSGNSYGRYSGYDRSYRGDMNSSYGRYSRNGDYSNARNGQHYARGHYSYGSSDMADKIQDMMDRENLSSEDKATLNRALDVLMR